MLYIISIGLADEKDMSLRAVEAAKKCDSLYAEFFTTKMNTTIRKLEKVTGKKIKEAKRSDLEEHSGKIMEEAKKHNVGILVGGDALSATTHAALLLEAGKKGVKCSVIHGSGIFTAVAETGLFLYKFGRTVTLPYPKENYSPESFYDFALLNKKCGLHTLILLDVQAEGKEYMDAHEGLRLLLEAERRKNKGLFIRSTKVITACSLGSKNQIIKYGTVKALLRDKSLKGNTPAVIILPAKLNFTEEEFLESCSVTIHF